MINILVVGEESWKIPERSDVTIYCRKEPADVDLCSDSSRTLYMLNERDKWIAVDCVIWRCQFCQNYPKEHKILDLISFTKTKCINSAMTNIMFGHNVSMFNAMNECKMPIIPRRFMIGRRSAVFVHPECDVEVFKVGDYHSGYAKSIIRNKETYQDTIDMACLFDDVQSLEPFVNYVQDIRILKIGAFWGAYERIPSMWKANVSPYSMKEIIINDIPAEIIEYTNALSEYIKADIIGVDWIKDADGHWYALEANLAPGIEKEDNYKEFASLL